MARTSVLHSKTLPQGEFISPEDFNHEGAPHSLLCGVAAKMLEFELAADLRDQIIRLRGEK